jgi:hypothetical protein
MSLKNHLKKGPKFILQRVMKIGALTITVVAAVRITQKLVLPQTWKTSSHHGLMSTTNFVSKIM